MRREDRLKNSRSLTFAKNHIEKNVKERVLFKIYKEHFERLLHLWRVEYRHTKYSLNGQTFLFLCKYVRLSLNEKHLTYLYFNKINPDVNIQYIIFTSGTTFRLQIPPIRIRYPVWRISEWRARQKGSPSTEISASTPPYKPRRTNSDTSKYYNVHTPRAQRSLSANPRNFLTQFLCQAICTQRTPKGPK